MNIPNTTPSSAFSCSTCLLVFDSDTLNKDHFKSEYHRYNLKRKLINLPSVTMPQYEALFEQSTNKSASQSDLRCEICSKTFLSPSTYSQHIASSKHKENRKKLLNHDGTNRNKSRSVSSEQFSVLSCASSEKEKSHESCLFCKRDCTQKHLATHNFPPFKQNCTDLKGLKDYVRSKIQNGHCTFCQMVFTSAEAVRQHMMDLGHGKLNTDQFEEYSIFYVWKIEEQDDDDEWSDEEDQLIYQLPQNPTLQDIEQYYASRIVPTPFGARIRGSRREIGVRSYRKFYKQYYRQIVPVARQPKHLAISNGDQHKLHKLQLKLQQRRMQAPKRIVKMVRSARTN